MKAVAEMPDGSEKKLFAIDDWDFNWQGRYNYAEPVRLPKGTVVRTTLVYDNSADNPRNRATRQCTFTGWAPTTRWVRSDSGLWRSMKPTLRLTEAESWRWRTRPGQQREWWRR